MSINQLRGISNEAAYITVGTACNIKLDLMPSLMYCNTIKVGMTFGRPCIAKIFIGPEVLFYCEGIL